MLRLLFSEVTKQKMYHIASLLQNDLYSMIKTSNKHHHTIHIFTSTFTGIFTGK